MILAAIQSADPAPAPTPDPLAGLRDIAPPVDVPWPPWVWWAIGVGSVLVLALLTWLIVWLMRRQPKMPPPTARMIALRELEELRAHIRELDSYAFSIRASDVLRTYVNGQFKLQATTQTSPEFLASIADSPQFSSVDRQLLATFLERCDMLKFARVEAHAEENEELLGAAAAFVQGDAHMNFDAFSFAQPWWLLALLAVPLVAWMQGGRGPSPAIRFSHVAPLRSFARVRRAGAGGLGALLLCAGLACLVVALARPRLGKTQDTIESSGVDIILELDVSGSMQAEDFTLGKDRASRIEVVKDVTKRFIEGRPNDRIGIIAFAGRPYLVSPLTLDHDWLLKNLERLRLGLVEDGTSIGSALASAANRMKDKKSKSKIIVLLTDGDENITTIPPATAAEAAKTLGIKIYTIAAGTNGLAPFPVGRDFLGNKQYRNIQVSVDEGQLRKVAEIGGGKFFVAMDTNSLNNIFVEIDKMEKTEVKLKRKTDWKDLFEWFIGAGAALAVLHALLSQTIWRTVP